jgi:hypothetical protein
MTSTPIANRLAALLVTFASLCASSALARDFASTRPAPRVEYWQQRQAAIDAQVADAASLRAVKLVFVGDSITDFWLLGDDPWIPGRMHGRRVWDESFGGAVPDNFALNIGISGDRTEHLLFRILPKVQGGLGQLDAEALVPEFFVLMVGINNSYAPEMPVAGTSQERCGRETCERAAGGAGEETRLRGLHNLARPVSVVRRRTGEAGCTAVPRRPTPERGRLPLVARSAVAGPCVGAHVGALILDLPTLHLPGNVFRPRDVSSVASSSTP